MRLFVRAVLAATVLETGEAFPWEEPNPPSAVTLGSRVRVTAPAVARGRVQGVVQQMDAEYLVLAGSGADRLKVPRQAITRLQIVTGRRGNARTGMWIGAGIGALGFGINPCVNEGCTKGFSPELAVYGALLGGMTGAGIGALVKSDRWTDVAVDRVRVTVVPARGRGVGLCVSVGF